MVTFTHFYGSAFFAGQFFYTPPDEFTPVGFGDWYHPRTWEELVGKVRHENKEFEDIPDEAAEVIAKVAEQEIRDKQEAKKELRAEIEKLDLEYRAGYEDYLAALRDARLTQTIAGIYSQIASEKEAANAEAARIQLALQQEYRDSLERERLALIAIKQEQDRLAFIEQQRIERRKRLMIFLLMSD